MTAGHSYSPLIWLAVKNY